MMAGVGRMEKRPRAHGSIKEGLPLKRKLPFLAWMLSMVLLCALWTSGTSLAQAAYPQGVLTLQELNQWASTLKDRVMTIPPLNDPNDPEANTEDGFAFVYEFITLYLDSPALTADSVVRTVVLTAPEEIGPRGSRIDMSAEALLALFQNDNPALEGTPTAAALYVADQLPSSANWGWVQRDGQRLSIIQYTVHQETSGGYTDAGLVYTMQANGVSAIRAYGLDQVVDEEDVRSSLSEMNLLKVQKSYRQVVTDKDGATLPPFQVADLTFGGVDVLGLTPEAAVAAWGDGAEETIIDEGGGKTLRTLEFEAVTVTFQYDGVNAAPKLKVFTIDMDGVEGPRALRVGDLISEVVSRFRRGEGAFNEATDQVIYYGTPGTPPYGFGIYQNDASAVLWYGLKTPTGDTVTMRLDFEQLQLQELTIQAEG